MNQVTTIRFDIFIGGDLAQVKQACREYCFSEGLCVTIEPVTFIYTGGEEEGVRVGIINYPRFPSTYNLLRETATNLAQKIMERCCQNSYSIVGPDTTEWFTRRVT